MCRYIRATFLQLAPKNGSPELTSQQTPVEAFGDLVWQYLPSVLITVMYAIFPTLFKKLAILERYYPATQQNVTIARYRGHAKLLSSLLVAELLLFLDISPCL